MDQQAAEYQNEREDTNNNEDNQRLKQKREETATEIRRQARMKDLNKFRKMDVEEPLKELSHEPVDNDLKNYIDQALKKTFSVTEFVELQACVNSNDTFKQHYGVIGIRKILSVEDSPPIQIVIDANLIPRLMEFIKQEDHAHLQLEACWALTNVASGSSHQTQAIIDKGGIQLFVKLLSSSHLEIAEQAIWALGNVAGDCAIYRDMILKSGGLHPLIRLIKEAKKKDTIKHGIWTLSNLCRGRPLPKFELVKDSIPILAHVLMTQTESEVLTDSAWAMSYLSDGDNDRIDLVINTGVIPKLIELLEHPYISILIPCLRTLGNIVTGEDRQTTEVLKAGALNKFFGLLSHEKRSVRREACWTLSNITAGNAQQIAHVVQYKELIEKLQTLMATDCPEIVREASWVLSNATSMGSHDDTHLLIQLGVLQSFVNLLNSEDVKTIAVVLEGINNILKKGKNEFSIGSTNPVIQLLEELGAVEKIENLQMHSNQDIYTKALKILEGHFELEEAI